MQIPSLAQTTILLVLSKVFVTFAWYGHLKKLQETMTLSIFVPFAMFYMHEPFKLDYAWAALGLPGAVYFIFRS